MTHDGYYIMRRIALQKALTENYVECEMIFMQFCPKCKSIMVPYGTNTMRCRKCGDTISQKADSMKLSLKTDEKTDVIVLEKDEAMLTTTDDRECPECGHNIAYFWLIQTRASDEPPTQFFRCVKCRQTWREYK